MVHARDKGTPNPVPSSAAPFGSGKVDQLEQQRPQQRQRRPDLLDPTTTHGDSTSRGGSVENGGSEGKEEGEVDAVTAKRVNQNIKEQNRAALQPAAGTAAGAKPQAPSPAIASSEPAVAAQAKVADLWGSGQWTHPFPVASLAEPMARTPGSASQATAATAQGTTDQWTQWFPDSAVTAQAIGAPSPLLPSKAPSKRAAKRQRRKERERLAAEQAASNGAAGGRGADARSVEATGPVGATLAVSPTAVHAPTAHLNPYYHRWMAFVAARGPADGVGASPAATTPAADQHAPPRASGAAAAADAGGAVVRAVVPVLPAVVPAAAPAVPVAPAAPAALAAVATPASTAGDASAPAHDPITR